MPAQINFGARQESKAPEPEMPSKKGFALPLARLKAWAKEESLSGGCSPKNSKVTWAFSGRVQRAVGQEGLRDSTERSTQRLKGSGSSMAINSLTGSPPPRRGSCGGPRPPHADGSRNRR